MTRQDLPGHVVHWVNECASTNDLASTLRVGEAVVAGSQTAGRGQYGRAWDAPPGSTLLLSLACGPRTWPAAVMCAWATVAVADAVRTLAALHVRIKWPNDIYVNGRKLCGILVESGHQVVIGVGLNLTRSRAEFAAAGLPEAGSIASESGVIVSGRAAAGAVLDALKAWRPAAETLGELESTWASRLDLAGREVVGERFDGAAVTGHIKRVTFAGLELTSGTVVPLEVLKRVRAVE